MIFRDRNTGKDIIVSFRPFEITDGPELRKCIADFYGNGYPYKKYLEPEFLWSKCREGNMTVLCGVMDSGEIVSVSALRFDGDFQGNAMLLLRVVKEKYRGLGIGAAQETCLFHELEKKSMLYSDYADVMTHNAVSQGSLIRRGFVVCAIRPALYRKRIMIPGLAASEEDRLSQVVMCRKESAGKPSVLYCPDEHRDAVESIYRKLNQPCILNSSGKNAELENSLIIRKDEKEHGSSVWIIREAGTDFGEILRNEKIKRKEEGTDILICYLNAGRPGAENAYKKMKNAGFYFTGIKPLNADGEYLVMADTGQWKPGKDDICLHPEGEWLLRYIRGSLERRKL